MLIPLHLILCERLETSCRSGDFRRNGCTSVHFRKSRAKLAGFRYKNAQRLSIAGHFFAGIPGCIKRRCCRRRLSTTGATRKYRFTHNRWWKKLEITGWRAANRLSVLRSIFAKWRAKTPDRSRSNRMQFFIR